MDPYLQSLVETRQRVVSCLKTALENVDAITKTVDHLNRQIEAHRPRRESPAAAASGADDSEVSRRAEIVPNVAFNAMSNVPRETLESASRAVLPREPESAAAAGPSSVAVKIEVDENVRAADEEPSGNEEPLDSAMALPNARDETKSAWMHPVVRLETLQANDATKRKRGRPPTKKRAAIGRERLWAPRSKPVNRWQK